MNQRQNIEQILDEFAAEHSHDQETLDRYINAYPEARLALLELASEIRLVSDEARFTSKFVKDLGADDAWSTFSSAKRKERHSTNPFRQFRGKQFAQLSDKLGVPRGFMIGIRDRRALAESIPERFLAAASKIMEITVEELRGYLQQEPRVLSTAEFKANQKPAAVEQVTFKQLIEDTEMSGEQRKTALEYLDNGRSN